jgi:hypothetical protein
MSIVLPPRASPVIVMAYSDAVPSKEKSPSPVRVCPPIVTSVVMCAEVWSSNAAVTADTNVSLS